LEAGIRMGKVWPQSFYGFQQSKEFTPAARLLMLLSMANQAGYLYKYHEIHHNHALFEMDGLALVSLAFPEFKQASKWLKAAKKDMLSEINWLIYPDGLSKELTTTYDIDVFKSFEKFKRISQHAHIKLSSSYNKTLEKMANYLAYSMAPGGYGPMNNDSDLRQVRSLILKEAKLFHRPDWKYIATNGKEGKKPVRIPSKTFPWAGINIMRSGWDKDAQWSFFDTGPYGTAHEHRDKLHLSVSAYGRSLLVDAGRYTYQNYFNFDPKTWRGYFRSSFSHNVIIVDGKGENAGPDTAATPMKAGIDYLYKPGFDYVRGTFKNGFDHIEGKLLWTRAILYKRGDYWVVVDYIKTDHPHKIQALWHYAPHCNVEIDGTEIVSTNSDKGNLRVIPVSNLKWSVKIVKGQTKPVKQGWFSPKMLKKLPESVAIYTTKINGPAIWGWILIPGRGKVPRPSFKIIQQSRSGIKIMITKAGKKPVIVNVPVNEKENPFIKKY
jgi:hypothetical protein